MSEILHFRNPFVEKLREALGIPKLWRRIIIDIPFNDVTVVYVEMLADAEKLDVLPIDVEGMKIVMTGKLNEDQ